MKVVSSEWSVVRRSFFCFALCASLFVVCNPVEAQQPAKVPRIGHVSAGNPNDPLEAAFGQALRGLGYVDGKNILIEYRYQEGKAARGPVLVAELVKLKVDVLVLIPSAALRAAKQATQTIQPTMQTSSGAPRSA